MTENLYTLRCPNCGRVVLNNLMNPGRNGDLMFQCECNAIVELYWKGGNEVQPKDCVSTENKNP